MFKKWSLICWVILFSPAANAQLIFSEDFDAEPEEATTGSGDVAGVAWEATCPDCLDDGDYFKVQGNQLVGQDTNGHASWESEDIDISSCDFIQIEFDLFEEGTMEACETGCNSVDYVMLEYNIDGTGWVAPEDASFCGGECADVFVIQSDDIAGGYMHYATNCIEAGTDLQVRITVQAWASSERWIIDNVEVSCTDGPEIDAGEDLTICEGTEVTLEADNPDGADLTWTDGVVDGEPFTPGVGEEEYVVSASAGGCTASDAVTITVLEAPTVGVDPAGPYTTESGIQDLEATPPGGTWSADCGACIDPVTGEFDPEMAGEGTWEICYMAGEEPCTDTECINITVLSGDCLLSGTISFNPPTCFGFSDGSVTANITGITGAVTYTITNEAGEEVNFDNSNTANSLSEGWYYIYVVDEFPCEFIDSVFLDDPDQMEVAINISHPLCYGEESGQVEVDEVLNYTGEFDNLTYNWAPNPNGENGIGQDSLPDAPDGEYNLLINDENGCTVSIDFELIDPDSLTFSEFGYYPAYCRLYGYQKGNGVVFAAGGGGTPDYSYEWENLETGETEDNTTWGGLNPGTYQFTMEDNNGCIKTATIEVDSLNPQAEFEMESTDFTGVWEGTAPVEITFINQSNYFANPNNPLADTVFFWNFDLGAGEELSEDVFETFNQTYTQAGDYSICLTVTNKNGCVDSTCKDLTIYDPFVFVPINVFSPNNDGVNDVFTFTNTAQSVGTFTCVIVNRWGKEMATLSGIEDTWDGTTPGGSAATSGVYFYTYSGESQNGLPFNGQGTIQLVRE